MKFLLTFLLLVPVLNAGLINGIALTVNEEPITLYEIDVFSQKNNITKEQATIELMKKILIIQGAKENNIEVTDAQITERMQMIMDKNGLNKEQFKQQLALQGLTYDSLFAQFKDQMLQQQFVGFITQGKISEPNEKEKKEFYQLHKQEFGMPSRITVTEYSSTNRTSLEAIQRSPLFSPSDVQKNDKTIDPNKIDPQLAQLLVTTKKGNYTQIIQLSQTLFGMFHVKSFGKSTIPDYDTVANRLGKIIQEKSRTELLNNFFADAMRKAHINYLRIKKIPLN